MQFFKNKNNFDLFENRKQNLDNLELWIIMDVEFCS